MRRFALTFAVVFALPVHADEDWTRLTGPEITAALTGKTFEYENTAVQIFYASGKTLYKAGQDSWGNWDARHDQYCSQWPPADSWACYDVEVQGDALRFVGRNGDITVGFAK